MNSIDSGKHNSSFNWYSGKSDTTAPKGSSVRIPITETTSAERPIESPIISEVKQNASTLVDSIRQGSPKEPSRINKPIFSSSQPFSHVAHKHPHSEDLTSSPLLELPMKRLKINGDSSPSLSPSPSPSPLDYNTVDGSDVIDFKFSSRVPSDIIALEEAERADRLKRRANPVLLGKFSRFQKELVLKVNSKPTTMMKEASTVVNEKTSGIVETLSIAKDAILEKGQSLIESTKEVINMNMHPLRQSLNEIAEEAAAPLPVFRPLLPLGETETIEFVWPRVSGAFKAAEESERAERIANRPSPALFSQWKSINAEILNKWNSSNPGFIFAKKIASEKASSLIGKASKAIDDVLQFTTEKIEQFNQSSTHDIEWFRLQEEKERARQINESPLIPSSKKNKALVDQQLLDVARRIRNQQ